MHNIQKVTYPIVILLLFGASYVFAEEHKKYNCTFDTKSYESYVDKEIPSSSILSRKSDETHGEVLLKVEGVKDFTYSYSACGHYGISIKASHIEPSHIEKVLDFVALLMSRGRMTDIFESLKSHIMSSSITSLMIYDPYENNMSIKILDNEDGTINIEISVSGG